MVTMTDNQLWGNEPALFVDTLLNDPTFRFDTQLSEMTIESVINDCLWNRSDVHLKMIYNACVISDSNNENESSSLLALYSDFVQHCFPSQHMTRHSFDQYITKCGGNQALFKFPLQDLEAIFRAFSPTMAPTIDLFEFCLGLAALDTLNVHGGPIGLERVSYVYRYYLRPVAVMPATNDVAHQQQPLTFDIRSFARDLMLIHNQDSSKPELLDSMEQSLRATFGVDNQDKISCVTENIFKQVVGSLKIRGTSSMFRATQSPINAIRSKPVYDIEMKPLPSTLAQSESPCGCPRCKKQFILARHSVLMQQDGTVVSPTTHRQTLSTTLASINSNSGNDTLRIARQLSNQLFSKNNPYNTLMDKIRWFNNSVNVGGGGIENNSKYNTNRTRMINNNGMNDSDGSEWITNRAKWAKKIITLCDQAKEVMKQESRIIRIDSPVYVLGDIHGNLHDLMVFESVLWQGGPACLTANYLFLGDYVDRGDCSVECITYLLCAKMLLPDRFHLVRGNHELRDTQLMFTFWRECEIKFGATLGTELWEHFNQVFDCMPVCAIVESKIFCAHGGIPYSATSIEQVERSLPCPMSDPERQCPIAWEILWNDPITEREYEIVSIQQLQQRKLRTSTTSLLPGYAYNTKRGTGYFYADKAVNTFLTTNGLSHVIRAHEPFPRGFTFHANGRVITVFSCSNYCNGVNDAAVMLIGPDCKIRPVRIDTSR